MTELEKILKCKNFLQAINIVFGKTYINGGLKNNLIQYCKEQYNVDIEQIVSYNNKAFCKKCGNEILGKNKHKRQFCSQSCAASFNNKVRGKRSEETKEKISESLIKTNSKNHDLSTRRNVELKRYEFRHICENENCHKEFFSYRKNQRFCSKSCAQNSDVIKNSLKDKMLEKVKNGTHSGWKTRNIKSYAEIFWEGVLTENGIPFKREDFSTKKYFLDFFIEKNGKKVDLEIDGKQHDEPDRKKHDEERDYFLSKNGYIVYRVKWNSINTEEGKNKMKEKISEFLDFIDKI